MTGQPEEGPKRQKPEKAPRPRTSVGVLVVAWLSFVVALCTLGLLGAAAVVGWELYVDHKLERHQEQAERAREEPLFVRVEKRCSATANGLTCSFSNATNKNALPVCVYGVIRNLANDVTLRSMAACSGVLDRFSTRSVGVEWIGGSPNDICYRESYGNRLLDWSKCEVTVDGPG